MLVLSVVVLLVLVVDAAVQVGAFVCLFFFLPALADMICVIVSTVWATPVSILLRLLSSDTPDTVSASVHVNHTQTIV